MNKFDKYKIPIFISLNILVLISLFGMAYAYFKATINNAESASTISVESGELTINYQGNTANIVASGIVPGWSETKKFTLSGKNTTKTNEFHTDNNLYYKIILAIDNNTFSEGALTYSIAKDSASSTNGKMADEASGTINQSGNQIIGYGYFSETSTFVDHIYNLTISFPSTEYEQSADNGKSFAAHVTIGEIKQPTTFAKDTWETIAAAIENGQLDAYPVGSTKTLKVYDNPNGETTNGTYKEYTVRVANNTTPPECNDSNFSQTACGFVVEFADIVENRKMNSTNTNVGGWESSEMRKYLNGDTDDHMTYNDANNGQTATFFSKLPKELRDAIENTTVVSGHGSTSGETNFTSTDKIYLLSAHEVWKDGTSNQVSSKDTAWDKTRQLDYYANLEVTTNNYSGAIKQYNSSDSAWWLRAAISCYNIGFLRVTASGDWSADGAHDPYGFAPAFRIG